MLLMPLVAFGQTPPPEVDQALRARTTEFFQDFVDGQYRKAFALVAEESQDGFFSSSKAEIKSFHIDSIQYNDNFTDATVNLTVTRTWRFQQQVAQTEVPMKTAWKTENGKWVWYNKVQPNTFVTPMGPTDATAIAPKPDAAGLPGMPDKITQEMINALGQKILQQSGLDKSQVTLSASRSSSDTVIFRNGAAGSVRLELASFQSIPGFSAKLDKTDLNLGESAALHIQYDPDPNRDKNTIPAPTSLDLTVVPFNQRFHVQVNFDPK